MKLFHDTGDKQFDLIIEARIHDISSQKCKEIAEIHNGIGWGLLLVMLLEYISNIKIPALVTLVVAAANCLVLMVRLFIFLFKKKAIYLQMDPNSKRAILQVSEGQLLLSTPYGDVPVFNDEYCVCKILTDSDSKYLCSGVPNRQLVNTLQEMLPAKIQRAYNVNIITTPQEGSQAAQILAAKATSQTCDTPKETV